MWQRLLSLFKNHLFTAFLPWIFFASLYGTNSLMMLIACLGALLLMVVLNFRELRKGFILPWGSVIVFALLAINSQLTLWPWGQAHASLLANSALAAIVLFSMVIGKPFTLQYAREQAPPERWHHPLFLKINWVLTSIWAVLLIIMALPSYFLTQQQIAHSWFLGYGLSLICIIIGLQCNRFVPKLMGGKR
ncbi:MAG: hypothetical protein AB7O90_19730 [Hyphomicrobium sp.]